MKKIIKPLSVILMIIAFLSSFLISYSLKNHENVQFKSSYKDQEVLLKGTYYKAHQEYEYAVLIAPGYSCDRAKWKPMADLFVSNGYPTLLFDYSGQGGSDGVIGFDNAKTDAIPVQINDAIDELIKLSGVDEKHIILVGHSMGGRAILRLLQDYNRKNADTTLSYKDIRNVILLSPEVNYHFNAQASLFAGTSDKTSEPWKSYSISDIGNAHLYLYGSYKDDIVSYEDVKAIYERLSNNSEITIVDNLLHSYFMYSDRIASYINDNLKTITGNETKYNPIKMNLVYVSWFLGLIGIGLFLKELNKENKKDNESLLIIENEKKFLISKLLLWIPGAIISFIICCICIVLPFGSPVMNIPYMNFIAGYGITMLIFYKLKKVKGTRGSLDKVSLNIKFDIKTILIVSVILFTIWLILFSTMYNLYPTNYRLFWLIFSTILMTIGFYVSSSESEALKSSSNKVKFLYNLNQYIPLFLLVGFYLILKSYSGMIGQACNMIFLYLIAIPLGNYLKVKTNNRLFGSFVSSLIFQSFMITSAALIAIL